MTPIHPYQEILLYVFHFGCQILTFGIITDLKQSIGLKTVYGPIDGGNDSANDSDDEVDPVLIVVLHI